MAPPRDGGEEEGGLLPTRCGDGAAPTDGASVGAAEAEARQPVVTHVGDQQLVAQHGQPTGVAQLAVAAAALARGRRAQAEAVRLVDLVRVRVRVRLN